MIEKLAENLLAWYRQTARDLPWRGHPDPYAVWVSEIMLQQTRVDTVLSYYVRWMAHFPTIAALAAANQQEVLNLWEGLGYYSRARNLYKAAQIVVAEHDGKLPADVKALEALPGIGRYTARAIASLSFGLDYPVVDGNVKRVLARVFNLETPVDTGVGEKEIWRLAEEHLPAGEAGDYNQALMELGALVCTPRSPDCAHCPLAAECRANALGLQTERPVKKPKVKTPHYTVAGAVIWRDGKVLIAQRPEDGLLGGLWEFPGGKCEDGETLPAALVREIKEELGAEIEVGEELGIYKHAYTHFKVTLHAFICRLLDSEPHNLEHQAIEWVEPHILPDYPMGKIDRGISQDILNG
ncbi:MAG: A/G-specific adenine glycosylase [Anaerolineales bacterium]|nr:A/G-specific adenine glycosylase [Anaerolineales bacterium]